jgi:hypothetical protein
VNLTLSHVTGATSTTLTFSGGAETLAITAFGTGQNVWYPTLVTTINPVTSNQDLILYYVTGTGGGADWSQQSLVQWTLGDVVGGSTSSPVAINVQEPTTTTLTMSSRVNGQITYTATVSSATGPPTGKVVFVDETTGVTLGTPTLNGLGVATLSSGGPAVGDWITAIYCDDTDFAVSDGQKQSN